MCRRTGAKPLALTGGFASYFLSHDAYTFPLPPAPPSFQDKPELFLAAQPLGTILWAVRKLGNLVGKDCVILGQGQNGLIMTRMLSLMGARRVIAVDHLQGRVDHARGHMGATHTIVSRGTHDTSVLQQVEAFTDGERADLVVEMVGHQPETLNECMSLVKFSGTILAFGVPRHGIYPAFNFGELFRRNITLIPSVFPDVDKDFPDAIQLLADERLDLSSLFTHRFNIDDIESAFRMSHDKSDGIIKLIFTYE